METENMPKPPAVLIRRTKAALHLILNRPEAINSLTFEMLLVIADEIAKAGSDRAVKLVVFSGSGAKGFCAGGDIKIMAQAAGKPMDIKKIALMASPVKFDDEDSGHLPIRSLIRSDYDPYMMEELFGEVNIPPQVIEAGMNEIQPGVQYTVVLGFYGRAESKESIIEATPFLYWLTHGTKFPVNAHIQWIQNIFIGNQIYKGEYCLPSENPKFNGKPVNMSILKKAGVRIFDYKGSRDPIAPAGSCVAGETWGQVNKGNTGFTSESLNRTIEKNIGHIFVVSRKLLAEYLALVEKFYQEPSLPLQVPLNKKNKPVRMRSATL
jgi:hypothetical protein